MRMENWQIIIHYPWRCIKDIPTVLVEHAFVDDDSDFENYLSSDAKLKALAEADAKRVG